MWKYLAIILIALVLVVAIFKFSLITNDSQSYCAFGPFAKHCHENVSYDDLYQTLRGITRAVTPNIAVMAFLFVAITLFGTVKQAATSPLVVRFVVRQAPLNLASAKKDISRWIELHEGGSPSNRR
ncbi:MAG TPA: hypothetical protein VMU07_03825 [Candidatus Paceibacterota bacterium]|nr:hypothetical protein [Candidatus Paceibacterota bacterium]